jgi:hypothetical protein
VNVDGGDWATIFAAFCALVSAVLVQRSSSRANLQAKKLEADAELAAKALESDSVKEAARLTADAEAYERARAYDIATIERQSAEILQVRADNIHLNADIKRVNRENQELFGEREALRNEIRVMHEERTQEREECRRVRQRLAHAIAEGRVNPEHEEEAIEHLENHRALLEDRKKYPEAEGDNFG